MEIIIIIVIIVIVIQTKTKNRGYKKLEAEILARLGFSSWNVAPYFDDSIKVKSRQALEKYDDVKLFQDNPKLLEKAEKVIKRKMAVNARIIEFLRNYEHEYGSNRRYYKVRERIDTLLDNTRAYRVKVSYISSAGNNLGSKEISVYLKRINQFKNEPFLLMTKGEYNKYVREKQKEAVNLKRHEYYNRVNSIIDFANQNRNLLVIRDSQKKLDSSIEQLYDRIVNSINKIKDPDSEDWSLVTNFINKINKDVKDVVSANQSINEYYKSPDFLKIKKTCEVMMSSQKEFNEYINEKVKSISQLFGTRIVRNETVNDDIYNFIRPYKKAITPFTAYVSASVFESAENNPLDYIIKYFYPNKEQYLEQIQKLCQLVEELETLKDAKQIIENYKVEYQKYIGDVPDFIMKNDESGFYERLGFATIDENTLTVEYKFSYTSGGGMAQRSFTVPMTEETIVDLIKALESKLTTSALVKEQRSLMTKKLRDSIKKRDNFTCCNCGNSIYTEPNLLLEIDHIIPVSKGGLTVEDNLQTLCWKCNRAKSNKIMN